MTAPETPPEEPVRYRGLKILAILGISSLLVGFGIERRGGLPDLSPLWRRPAPSAPAEPDLDALDGDEMGDAETVLWNGQPTRTQQFRSELTPGQVADLYARKFARSNVLARGARESGVETAPGATELVNRFDSPYYSIAVTRGEDGRHVGVVALPHPKGGSTYFLSETMTPVVPSARSRQSGASKSYDVPAPPFSTEECAIDGLGEPGSRLALYHSRAERARILRFYAEALPDLGWTRLEDEGDLVNESLERGYLMLFRRGFQELVIATMPRSNGLEAVTIMFRNKTTGP